MKGLIHEQRANSFELVWQRMGRERARHRDEGDVDWQGVDQLPLQRFAETIAELDSLLPEVPVDDRFVRAFTQGHWSIGGGIQTLTPREVLRGFIVPVKEVPSGVAVTLKVFALLTVEGHDDLLDRHLHGGIHYHYVLRNRTYTKTLLCWDTRWSPTDLGNDPTGLKNRPLFNELHAEGKNRGNARPGWWGDEKRRSIRNACESDLARWPIREFRCASNGATPVWPIGAVLTPR